jgi:hypothetical protein
LPTIEWKTDHMTSGKYTFPSLSFRWFRMFRQKIILFSLD